MCGITGFFNTNSQVENGTFEIASMLNILKHRGPDDMGIVGVQLRTGICDHLNPNVRTGNLWDAMIGFVRLSIRDLSLSGHQPMVSPDGKVILTFNGEIYNADQFRNDLINKGVQFKGTSDTEIILYLYLIHGIEKTSQMLNGMFAISILDMRINKLFLLRDRVGIKPLYYTAATNRFAYASEIKCFLALKDFVRQLSYDNLVENFTFYKPLENILLENVYQVEAGQYIVVDTQTWAIKKYRYFSLDDYVRPNLVNCTYAEIKQKAIDKLSQCVKQQKVSDVKVGCQLSGGVDSSMVTYFASLKGQNPLKDSISVIFDGSEKGYSEEKYMHHVGEKCGVDIHETIMNVDYVMENYERTLWHGDTVIGRPNSIGLLMLTQKARESVTVLVSGEGADELMGGYEMFSRAVEVETALASGKPYIIETVRNQPEIVNSFAEYAVISQQKTNEELCSDILPGYSNTDILNSRIEQFNSFSGSNFDRQIKYAMTTYLPELLLCQDKMSMANSIENRVPVLDNDFIDFAFSVPQKYLIQKTEQGLQGKYLLKDICADVFGYNFAYRKKMGFGLPYYRYFLDTRFRSYFYETIVPGSKKRGIVNVNTLIHWYEQLGQKPWGECELFWKACSLEAWCQMFIDGRSPMCII